MGKLRDHTMGSNDDFGELDLDRHVQNFKSCLRVILSDERLMHGGKSTETEVIDKCSVALNQMVELHYNKLHLKDVLRRGREEIDWLKNKIRDSGTLCNHLKSVQTTHEERIDDLTTRLRNETTSNANKENKIKSMQAQIETIKGNTENSKAAHKNNIKNIMDSQMRIYQEGRQKLQDLDAEKTNLIAEFEEAKNSTAGLKVALESARNKLSDAIEALVRRSDGFEVRRS